MNANTVEIKVQVDTRTGTVSIKQLESQTGKSFKQMESSAKSASTGMKSSLTSIKGSYLAVAGAAATAALALGKVTGQYAPFEKEMANVSTLVDTSTVSMEKLEKGILALPSALGPATENTRGLYQALSAGVEPAKSVEFIGKAAKAAKAGLSDTFTAVDTGTTLLNAFGLETEKATEVYDLMFTTVKEGKTTFNELAAAEAKISPIAAAANVSIYEQHAALATLTKGGFKTTEASARLATALGAIIKPSSEAEETAERLGLKFDAQALAAQGLHGFLQDVKAATGGNIEEMAKLFGGMESLSVILALTGEQSQEFTDILGRMKNTTGAVDEAFEKQKHTLDALWNTFTTSIGKQVILLGDKLSPKLKEVLEKTTAWLEANRDLIAQKTGEHIDTIVSALSRFSENYENIKNIVIELGKFYVIAKTVSGLTAVITFVEGMTIATAALQAKQALLNETMKQNLIILIAYGAYKTGEYLTNWQMGNTDAVKEDIKEWEGIKARLEAKLREAQSKVESGLERRTTSSTTTTDTAEAAKTKAAADAAAKSKIDAAQTAAKKEIEAIIAVAGQDRTALQTRLAEYEQFYSSLQAKIAEAAESEKRHITELNALYKQKADLQQSTEDMVRAIKERSMSESERYASQEQALNSAYTDAMRLSGQEKIDALEKYKQSVASLASTYSTGVTETYTRFGEESKRVILSAEEVAQKAVSAIETAAIAQKKALDELTTEKQKQIRADRTWGDMLQSTARDAAAEIETLKATIENLSASIDAMQKLIEIEGVDLVSPVVDSIRNELDSLHDKTITITTVYRTVGVGSGGGEAEALGSYQKGTDYVPKTGLYMLHEGEKVVTRDRTIREIAMYNKIQERSSVRTVSAGQSNTLHVGSIQIIVPETAAPQTPADWRAIVRNQIIPELRKVGYGTH
ncbi:MAG: phage tail tape measure protein [Deltaproteobacteria bacterium]|nr:phage tail tape measure protein [Deltaproteobacteria bacterium]